LPHGFPGGYQAIAFLKAGQVHKDGIGHDAPLTACVAAVCDVVFAEDEDIPCFIVAVIIADFVIFDALFNELEVERVNFQIVKHAHDSPLWKISTS
jgi:hypothetical protein